MTNKQQEQEGFTDNDKNKNQAWGLSEEFLLVSAVHRYGDGDWDTVVGELQKRSSSVPEQLYTPQTCREKYLEIQQRYSQSGNTWLDDLRKLRVEELERQLERNDLNIVALELKVKRLKQEREEDEEAKVADLEIVEDDGKKVKSEPGKPDSDKEELSVNESNSTDLKLERETRVEPGKSREVDGVVQKQEEEEEESCDGSSKPERVNSGEMGESVAESKGGEEEEEEVKESSDVQSSVSLSRKKDGEEENEEGRESTVENRVPKESESLMEFLDVLRGNKIGSFFELKLDSQDSSKYANLIRQHLDFQTIQVRLQEGHYARCSNKFFRDLLLLANNALVFYGPKSAEFKAATELRLLVHKEMAFKNSKTDPSSNVKAPGLLTLKMKPDLGESLLAKSKLSLPLTACRKRSSITAKASSSSSGADARRIPPPSLLDEKPPLDTKQVEKSSSLNAEEPRLTKKRTRERFPSGGKSSVKNSKIQTNSNKNFDANFVAGSDKGGVTSENSGPRAEKKNQGSTSGKKQSAANFLNRMKQSPSSSNSLLAETLRSSKSKPESSKGAEQKKTSSGRIDARKDQRKGSGAKQVKEKGSPSKKNVGRPPKRGAAPQHSLPAKRTRDASETSGSRQAKKRSRK